jgi:hypothetical protein
MSDLLQSHLPESELETRLLGLRTHTKLRAVCIGSNALNSRRLTTTARWKALVT